MNLNYLIEAVATVKDGANFETEKKYGKAIDKYNCAIVHFRNILESKEESVFGLRLDIEKEVDYFTKKINKLKMLQGKHEPNLSYSDEKNEVKDLIERVKKLEMLSSKEKQNCDCNDPDVKIRNRIKSTILKPEENAEIKFNDVCGLKCLKEDLFQAAILPLMQPQLFSKNIKPYKGFLLFGPPGTGKTFIAKALAGEIGGTNFFSISVGNVLSKYIGESESYIRNLFEVAREAKPSIIFFDEIDVLAKKRTDTGNDSCQGVLNELLAQMDGIKGSNDGILIMATTNVPQQLDNGILRRFDKLIYVPLPTHEDRIQMFKQRYSMPECAHFTNENFDVLASETSGFSGSDISIICNEANNMALARVVHCNSYSVSRDDGNITYMPYLGDGDIDPNVEQSKTVKLKVVDIPYGSLSAKPIATFTDLTNVISQKRPSIPKSDIDKYEEFVKERVGNCYRTRNTLPVPDTANSFLDILCIFIDCLH